MGQATHRKAKRAALEAAWLDAHRARTKQLRAELASARERRAAAMSRAVGVCRTRRKELRETLATRRAEFAAALKAEREAKTKVTRCACAARKARVRRGANQETARIKAALAEELRSRREELEHLGRRRKEHRQRLREVEGRQTDEEVERELPEELVTVWRKTRRQFRGTERRSRAEAFLQWVEENPAEVVALQDADAERATKAMIRELQVAEQAKPSRRRVASDLVVELARLLPKKEAAKQARRLLKGHEPDAELSRRITGAPSRFPVAARALELAQSLGNVPF
jgi:hypothetical protein